MIRQKFLSIFASLAVALGGVTLSVAPIEAEAKRLGGSRPAGMQRQAPPPKQQPNQPAQNQNTAPQQGTSAQQPGNTAAAAGAAGAAAQAGKRSWMGPIAGLAAGLGLAALASHLGFGEELANFMMMALLAIVAMVVIGWLMRRFRGAPAAGPQLAGAGAGAPMSRQAFQQMPSGSGSPAPAAPAAAPLASAPAVSAAMPAGFDAAGFERIAKMIFIRLQAANDAGQVDDLRKFTTPELFASLRLDLQERGGVAQQTDVLELNAELVDTAQENGQWVVSVRFTGLIREEADAGAQPFDELWHLVRPLDESRDWAIAGITPLDAA
ncbi:TIM44-like domain-containing protein [Aquabacterium fontiphilum]|uniref:Tim44 domain-containing protein n=1 Tax=Aquabacterium fontiphilum TaxID=450365 RepID=UPI001378249A|nr:Tim44-like domain-containing protein [Aquabacterium fontiphilum]NBD20321.1 TIM44-like domain-containing protein [Aquabacterium fontiphilum]